MAALGCSRLLCPGLYRLVRRFVSGGRVSQGNIGQSQQPARALKFASWLRWSEIFFDTPSGFQTQNIGLLHGNLENSVSGAAILTEGHCCCLAGLNHSLRPTLELRSMAGHEWLPALQVWAKREATVAPALTSLPSSAMRTLPSKAFVDTDLDQPSCPICKRLSYSSYFCRCFAAIDV